MTTHNTTHLLHLEWKEDYFNMENLLFLVIGALLMHIFSRRPLQITIHHKHEDIHPVLPDLDMDELEQGMLKEDPKMDDLYNKLDETLMEVNNIMGGSDR